jgi:cell division protein FtsW
VSTVTARVAVRRGPSSYVVLLAVVTALCLTGLVMVLSASSVTSLRNFDQPWYYFEHQLMWLVGGVVAFFVARGLRTAFLERLARPLLVATFLSLFAVLAVGRSAGGASRWLGAGPVTVQPSELAKLALVLFGAYVLARREGKRTWLYRAVPVLLAVGGMAFLVVLQPDMGTAMVICFIGAAILFAAGIPVRLLLALSLAGGALAYALANLASYRAARLASFLNPFAHATTSGYQAVQGLIALGGGHWFGTGVGQSVASWGYLPNQYTDFIFAVIGQETGFTGSLVLLSLFATLGVVGTKAAAQAASSFESLVAAGVTAWLVGQAMINIGAVAGALPVTGVPLPFVSYGGSSLVVVLFAVGLLAKVARGAEATQKQ